MPYYVTLRKKVDSSHYISLTFFVQVQYNVLPYLFALFNRMPVTTPMDVSSSNNNNKSSRHLLRLNLFLTGTDWASSLLQILKREISKSPTMLYRVYSYKKHNSGFLVFKQSKVKS